MNTILTRAFGAAFLTVAVTEFTQIGALLIDGIIIEHGFTRKSGANRAEIRVTLNNDSLIIRVRDNGREFDLSKLANILTDESAPYSNIGIKLICRSAKDIHYYRIWGMNTTILEI